VRGTRDDLSVLDSLLSDGAMVTDIEVMGTYRRDRADIVPAGIPRAVVRAAGLADVSATLSWANRHGIAVVPRGAGTGLSGGANAIDGCIVLSLERLTAIREIDRVGQYAVVEAGVINADLGRAAAAAGLFYPPDPGSFEICSIGGNLATNAGGMRCVKYGVTRDSALSLEVVLADGTVINTGSRTRKNAAGYDLTSLFIGSEGTLGVITAATLRLRPPPRPRRSPSWRPSPRWGVRATPWPPSRRPALCRACWNLWTTAPSTRSRTTAAWTLTGGRRRC
jgi:glycolate oxidase